MEIKLSNLVDILEPEIQLRLELAGKVIESNVKKYIVDNNIIDTGRLLNSIESNVIDNDTVQIGSNVDYAAYVEFGTSKQSPRPYLRTSLDNSKKEILDVFKDLV